MSKNKQQTPTATPMADEEMTVQPTSLVRKHILAVLGRPPHLLRVDVACLWKNAFRANVLVGKSLDNARFEHSYFVETNDDGEIKNTTPKLTKVYD